MAEEHPSARSTMADGSVSPAKPKTAMAQRIGRFAILERIGAGGMGEVYAAYDEQLDRKIALKVLHRSRALSPVAQTRLLREAQALARLSHPHVVTVFEAGIHDEEVFMAMEFVRGTTVQQWLTQAPRTWAEILAVFIAAAQGLAAMHEHGLVHRDFKPDNAIIDQRGRLRLIDFGLVRDLGPRPDQEPTEDADAEAPVSLTRSGALLGTPMYMSPEQFRREPITPASDQFSLCVAFYEALAGRSPFTGEHTAARAHSVLEGELVPFPDDTNVPSELIAVVERGLRPDPETRWASMAELIEALEALLASYDPEVEGPEAVRRQRWLMARLLLIPVLVLVSFGLLMTSGSTQLDAGSVLGVDFAIAGLVSLGAWKLRDRWWKRRITRRGVVVVVFVAVTIFLQDLVGYLADRSHFHSALANLVTVAVVCAFTSPLVTRGLVLGAGWALACTAAMLLDPPHYFAWFNIGTLGAATVSLAVAPRRSVDKWIRAAATQGSSSVGPGSRSRLSSRSGAGRRGLLSSSASRSSARSGSITR